MRYLACLLILVAVANAEGWLKEDAARTQYAAWLKEKLPGFEVESFKEVPLTAVELKDVAKHLAIFSAQTTRVEGTYHLHTLLFRPGCGAMMDVWEEGDSVKLLREILASGGIQATDEASVRKAGLICLLLPVRAGYEEGRVEVTGRTFIYHEHCLTLLSGRLGTYTEDRIIKFDDKGDLASIEETGEKDLTMKTFEKLTADPDPWLQLNGFVPDSLKAKVEAKKSQRKTPIHHESK